MTEGNGRFGVNTYSYTLDWPAADCLRHLADQGYRGIELMMYPGHLWPDLAATGRRDIRRAAADAGMRIISLNMPNIDINIAGASEAMRQYSLNLLSQFVQMAGDLGAPSIIIGPGKANPLFPARRAHLLGHFYRALDQLAPIAAAAGTRLLVENMPFAFLPDADGIMQALSAYGDDRIGVIYDVANAHFIGEDPRDGLRRVQARLALVHLSDTFKSVYRHDPVGMGDVPFGIVPPVLQEVGYTELPMLEVISPNPDADIRASTQRLAALGYAAPQHLPQVT
jgi:sugar phosphate isomerase/epimerase